MYLRSALVALLWLALPCAYAASPSDHASGADATATTIATLIPNMVKVLAARPLLLRMHAPRFTWSQTFQVRSAAIEPDAPLADVPFAAAVEQLPVIGTVRRRAAQHFNTTDSSHPNDFALCYRLSQRMGLQVMPSDSAPPGLVMSRLANNVGVAFGMTIRMDHLK